MYHSGEWCWQGEKLCPCQGRKYMGHLCTSLSSVVNLQLPLKHKVLKKKKSPGRMALSSNSRVTCGTWASPTALIIAETGSFTKLSYGSWNGHHTWSISASQHNISSSLQGLQLLPVRPEDPHVSLQILWGFKCSRFFSPRPGFQMFCTQCFTLTSYDYRNDRSPGDSNGPFKPDK